MRGKANVDADTLSLGANAKANANSEIAVAGKLSDNGTDHEMEKTSSTIQAKVNLINVKDAVNNCDVRLEDSQENLRGNSTRQADVLLRRQNSSRVAAVRGDVRQRISTRDRGNVRRGLGRETRGIKNNVAVETRNARDGRGNRGNDAVRGNNLDARASGRSEPPNKSRFNY